MIRTVVIVGTLLLGVGVVAAQQDQVAKTQLAMKSNGKNLGAINVMAKGEKPYDQAAVDGALAGLQEVADRFATLFPESIKGLQPDGDYYASPKVWTERANFEAHSAGFAKAVVEAKGKIKNLATLKAEMPALIKVCSNCHETFRVKKG
ncbi:cytochrome c [Bradyrhizobium sp. URHD0069]|uniref:c-type cytochrome n=1 Tax=Bradyrhizobium sp. URHD0069 TaxID=1380355 RepID=UPI000498311D|nr:cytochrome c [Bradyrhizobium sp. URHD0069]